MSHGSTVSEQPKGAEQALHEHAAINRIFDTIGRHDRWCVELGALDGAYNCNTAPLIREEGWSAVLIEAETRYFRKLTERYASNSRVTLVHRFVGFEGSSSLDAILGATAIPHDFDLLVLDVDGNDYHLWESVRAYRPRVVCIEFNPTIPNDIEFVQPRDMRIQQGSSLNSIEKLARKKGYRLVATTAVNAFFVVEELFGRFSIADASLDALHADQRYIMKLFQLYDGTLVLSGYRRLYWHRLPIKSDQLQVLPRWKRHYPAAVHPSDRVRRCKDAVRKLPFYKVLLRLKQRIYRAR